MQDIPYGFCHCGCGQKTRFATKTDASTNRIKGCPNLYVHGHHAKVGRAERFVVENRGYETPCHIWTGRTDQAGYGYLVVDGRITRAHRWNYERLVAQIPVGAILCHRCDIPACIRPDHLFPGSQADNMRDMARKERGANQISITTALRAIELLELGNSVTDVGAILDISRNAVGAIRGRRGRWADLLPVKPERTCPECQIRPVDDARPNAKYCSKECKVKAHRRFCRERNRRNYRLQHGLPLEEHSSH